MILKASEEDISEKLLTVQTSVFSSSETDCRVSSAPEYLLGAHPLNKMVPKDLYNFFIKKNLK